MGLPDDPDVQLMMRAKEGSNDAFAQLFSQYFAAVLRFFTLFLGDAVRAEELAQEVFVNLYKARHRYRPRARFRSFLFRIAAHLAISERRSQARQRRLFHRNSNEPLQGPRAVGETLPWENEARRESEEDVVARREELGRVCRALERLPERQRVALLLVRAEGLSYEQVSAALGVSVSAVKSLVHRATVTIRKECKEDWS